MDGEIPGAEGFDPDDPGHGDSEEPDGIRGWIPPDDRLWRHPSEVGSATSGRPHPPPVPARGRTGPWVVGGASACLAGALLVTGLVMAATGASPDAAVGRGAATSSTAVVATSPTTNPGALPVVAGDEVARMVSSVRPSVVALAVTRRSGSALSTGVVAESGGIVATNASAVEGATSVSVVEPGGAREPAEVVGVDPVSGVAVVRIATDLPVAPFSTGDPLPGAPAIALALDPGRGRSASPHEVVYAGTVRSSGTAVGADAASTTFASTTVDAPLGTGDWGCPLIDAGGHVSGILETIGQSGGTPVSVFLPAELVLGVTRQLVSTGEIDHGWLGIEADDAPASAVGPARALTAADTSVGGAVVRGVEVGGAAFRAGLEVGDMIVAIDGDPVHSLAELRTRLYADRPGTTVAVTFERGGQTGTAVAVLTDGQGGVTGPNA